MLEFEQTPSSKLTAEEFMKLDLPSIQNPPCFERDRATDLKHITDKDGNVEKVSRVDSVEESIESAEASKTRSQKAQERRRMVQQQFYEDLEDELKNMLPRVQTLGENILNTEENNKPSEEEKNVIISSLPDEEQDVSNSLDFEEDFELKVDNEASKSLQESPDPLAKPETENKTPSEKSTELFLSLSNC